MVTKPTIFQRKSKDRTQDKGDGDYSPFVNSTNNPSVIDKSTEHCEYMCKMWQKLVTHRFIFSKQVILTQSKSEGTKQVELFTVKGGALSHPSASVNSNFYITEFGVVFMQ